MSAAVIIETIGLSKRYRKAGAAALDDLSLQVQQGEIFGYLGPNGAGKTTTIRLLLDLIRPTHGSAKLFGEPVRGNLAVRSRLGYLPGELSLWDGLTARETIAFFGRLQGRRELRYVDELAQRLDFDLSRKVREFSTGNKRKLGLILALMHKPELLVLDEPTTGLDPLVQQTFYQLMLEAKAEGRTVFLSSHILGEVQAICDRVGILRGGQLRAVQSVKEMTHKDFRYVTVRFSDAPPMTAISELTGVRSVEQVDARTVTMQYVGPFDPLLRAIGTGYVEDLRVQEPSLEEIFLTFYEDTPAINGKVVVSANGAVMRQGERAK
jgi:ABC-2 type transport system ATP-binding protein